MDGAHRVQEPAEPGRVRLAQRLLAGGVQRADRVPVIAGTASDHGDPAGVAPRHVVRPCHLESGLDGLRPAAHRVDPGIRERKHVCDILGVGLDRVGREHRPVDVLRAVELLLGGGDQ